MTVQRLDAARDAILKTVLKHGRARAALDDILCDLENEVTIRAANYELRQTDLKGIYLTRMQALSSVNKTEKSVDAQVSKLMVFWRFGHRFRLDGVAFVQNWRDSHAPRIRREKLLTEMRKRLDRDCL